MEKHIVGLDSGFGYGIMCTANGFSIVENYIEEVSKSTALSVAGDVKELNTDKIVLKYNDRYFLVGTLCKRHQLDAVHRYSRDRKDIYHLIEILSLLGFVSTDAEYEVQIVLGLPNSFRKERKEFITWLQGNYEFSYLTALGEIKKNIIIKDLDFIPQPYAPILTLPEDKQNKFICSIDIGHGSLDYLLVDDRQIVKQAGTFAYGEGVKRVYKELEQLILDEYKEKLKIDYIPERRLQQAIETGEYIVGDETLNIKPLLEYALEKYIDYIFTNIERNLGAYLTEVDIFIASGGMLNNIQFKQKLADRFKSVYNKPFMTSKTPQLVIAEGMYRYANLRWSDNDAEQDS